MQFSTNAIETRTTGLNIVANHKVRLGDDAVRMNGGSYYVKFDHRF